MINRARMLAEFLELVRIKCSTGQEREVADLIKAKLAELGLETEEDDAGGDGDVRGPSRLRRTLQTAKMKK